MQKELSRRQFLGSSAIGMGTSMVAAGGLSPAVAGERSAQAQRPTADSTRAPANLPAKSANIYFLDRNKAGLVVEPVVVGAGGYAGAKPGDPAMPAVGNVYCQAVLSMISSGTETHELRGVFSQAARWNGQVKFPFAPGYNMVARVLHVDAGVEHVKPGDLVYAPVPHKQYFSMPATMVFPLPAGLEPEDACWSGLLAAATGSVRKADIKLGDTVVVVGLGVFGLTVLQLAALSGASRIVAIDPIRKRADQALAHGATDVLNVSSAEAKEALQGFTGGRMANVVFEVTGTPLGLSLASDLGGTEARIMLLGDTPDTDHQIVSPNMIWSCQNVSCGHIFMALMKPSAIHPLEFNDVLDIAYRFVLAGRVRVRDLVSHRVSPREAPAVYGMLLERREEALGVTFDWSQL